MKYCFVIITLTALMLQTFSKGLILAEFILNQDYIAKVLCVNRAKPELACKGQCQLMKQMEKDTQKEQSGNALKDKYEVIFADINTVSGLIPYIITVQIATPYDEGIPHIALHTVFHPPQA